MTKVIIRSTLSQGLCHSAPPVSEDVSVAPRQGERGVVHGLAGDRQGRLRGHPVLVQGQRAQGKEVQVDIMLTLG